MPSASSSSALSNRPALPPDHPDLLHLAAHRDEQTVVRCEREPRLDRIARNAHFAK
jgi:hypothetical protein